MFGQLSLIDS